MSGKCKQRANLRKEEEAVQSRVISVSPEFWVRPAERMAAKMAMGFVQGPPLLRLGNPRRQVSGKGGLKRNGFHRPGTLSWKLQRQSEANQQFGTLA